MRNRLVVDGRNLLDPREFVRSASRTKASPGRMTPTSSRERVSLPAVILVGGQGRGSGR